MRPIIATFTAVLAAGALAPAVRSQDAGELLLPDIAIRRSDLFDNDIVTNIRPGRVHLRLSNGTPNIGAGKFHVYGASADPDSGLQPVIQRIFRRDGTFVEREAGRFVFHRGHNHIHIENWALYRLRAVLVDGSPGDVVAEGEKTSFCILDLQIFNRNLPGFNPDGEFHTCASTTQGLSVGWVDIYDKTLEGQNIDITGLPAGRYWLESLVDPDDHFLESNEDNNVERIEVTIPGDGTLDPDPYEPNDTLALVTSRPEGGFNSPNLGPTNPKRTVANLTIHQRGGEDFFRFYTPDRGRAADFVRIDFAARTGDLELDLLDAEGRVLASSHRADVDFELVSLEGIERGWYFVRISGRGGDISPSYVLTVNPAANDAPQIEVVNPRSGDEKKPHGIETYPVLWRATDPESERTWVTVFLAPEPILDARAHLLPTSLHTRGELGFHVVNSADVPPGSYWVFCQVTDGGTTTGDWSAGTVTFVDVPDECTTLETPGPDCNANGILDACDIDAGLAADCDANGQPDTCDLATPGADDDGDGVLDRCEPARFRRGDVNDDGAINVSDPVSILRFLFVGSAAPACLESADIDNDARIVLSDAVNLLGFLFRGGPAPAPPAATSPNCGRDPDPPESSGDLGCTLFTSC